MIYREDILADVQAQLTELLDNAPSPLSKASCEAIKDEFTDYTNRVLDALTTEELQSEAASRRFVQSTLAQARMRMRMK